MYVNSTKAELTVVIVNEVILTLMLLAKVCVYHKIRASYLSNQWTNFPELNKTS